MLDAPPFWTGCWGLIVQIMHHIAGIFYQNPDKYDENGKEKEVLRQLSEEEVCDLLMQCFLPVMMCAQHQKPSRSTMPKLLGLFGLLKVDPRTEFSANSTKARMA